jgi:hypothetical protein
MPKNRTSRNAPGKPPASTGDVITIHHVGENSVIAAGRNARASSTQVAGVNLLGEWRDGIVKEIEASRSLSPADKADARQQVDKITAEAAKGRQADVPRLEKLVNTLRVMAPDIFEVALTTLANPLAGLGLVAKKIGEKAKIERKLSGE